MGYESVRKILFVLLIHLLGPTWLLLFPAFTEKDLKMCQLGLSPWTDFGWPDKCEITVVESVTC